MNAATPASENPAAGHANPRAALASLMAWWDDAGLKRPGPLCSGRACGCETVDNISDRVFTSASNTVDLIRHAVTTASLVQR